MKLRRGSFRASLCDELAALVTGASVCSHFADSLRLTFQSSSTPKRLPRTAPTTTSMRQSLTKSVHLLAEKICLKALYIQTRYWKALFGGVLYLSKIEGLNARAAACD